MLHLSQAPEWKNVLFLENNRRSLAFKKNSKGNDKDLTFFFVFSKFPPLPAKAQVNASAKVVKQLGEYIKTASL